MHVEVSVHSGRVNPTELQQLGLLMILFKYREESLTWISRLQRCLRIIQVQKNESPRGRTERIAILMEVSVHS
uniref:Uncharacterized protein n=1 Tax=Rhizophora mucronata TaxID=61149 RepID=A0A2P2NYG1_RHIMU